MRTRWSLLPWLVLAACSRSVAAAPTSKQAAELEGSVRGFYFWALRHGADVDGLQPAIREVAGSTRFSLDTSRLAEFSEAIRGSGCFSAGFGNALGSYYRRYRTEFDNYTQGRFDTLAGDGRGPLMEVEDMDLFFCAQEYQGTKAFVRGMKLDSVSVGGDTARAVSVSPLGWRTPFWFVREGGRWKISGYCVFH